MAEIPYGQGVATVAPDSSAPSDYIKVNVNPDAFGAGVAKGIEHLGAGVTAASDNAFKISDFYDKIAGDDALNKVIDISNTIRRGDPGKTVQGPDGKPQPDVGYLGTVGQTALEQREPAMKALDDAIAAGRNNLKSDKARLTYDSQIRRYRAKWEDEIGAHSQSQFKVWGVGVNNAEAKHANDHIAANPDGEEFRHGEADLINARVKGVQIQFGDDPTLKLQAIASAKQEALKTQLSTIGARDPSRAVQILDERRNIAGADYAPMMEHLRGRADQQDGVIDGRARIARQNEDRAGRPYGNASNPVYAQVAAEVPGGMSATGLARAVQIESSGDPNASNKSDHVGLGAFSKTAAAEVGITDRKDPEQSIRGIARYAAKNAPMLTKALGRAPDDAELYLGHQQGAGGAAKLFNNPDKRAGDLVGDDHIRDNGGNPDAPAREFTEMWKAKFNKAAVATGESSPAESLAHREGELKMQIFNDPAMADRPQMQAAALGQINQYFTAQREVQSNDTAAFKQRRQNSEAEVLNTGVVQNPLTPIEFNTAYGSTAGAREYEQYLATVQLGADTHAIADMAPEQIETMRASYVPKPGSDDYVQQLKRKEQIDAAVEQNKAERDKDPAAFAIARLPAARSAFVGFSQVMSDKTASPKARAYAAANYAEITLAEQARIGVPPEARTILTADQVSNIAGPINMAATADDPAARQNIIPSIKAQSDLWGNRWPDVAQQILPNAAPIVKAIAAGADPDAMLRVLSIPKNENPPKILKEQNEVTARNMNSALNIAMAPFLNSMVGLQKDRDYKGYHDIAEKLAALYVRDGKGAEEAAQSAFDDVIGKRYTFADTYRIPKAPGVNADDVQRGAYEARQNILRGKGAGPDNPFADLELQVNDIGVSDNDADSRRNYYRNGTFVTSPKNDGLNIAYHKAGQGMTFLKNTAGEAILLTWDQLQKMGGTKEARAADAARGTFNSAATP